MDPRLIKEPAVRHSAIEKLSTAEIEQLLRDLESVRENLKYALSQRRAETVLKIPALRMARKGGDSVTLHPLTGSDRS
jgi:hypothetical protein